MATSQQFIVDAEGNKIGLIIPLEEYEELLDYSERLGDFDEELVKRCMPLLNQGKYDDAVRYAFLILEKALREATGIRGEEGPKLAGRAFSDDSLLVKRLDADPGMAAALRQLYSGAFGVFRNPTAHHLDVGYEAAECREILILVNLLLRQLKETQSPYARVFAAIDQILRREIPADYGLRRTTTSGRTNYMQVHLSGIKSHYEITFRSRDRYIEVALHFEEKPEFNRSMLQRFRKREKVLRANLQGNFFAEEWGAKWAKIYQKLPWVEPEQAPANEL